MADSLHVDQTGTGSIKAVDSKGNLVTVTYDSPPTWTVSDPAVATLTPSTNGTTVLITPLVTGVVTVSVSASIGGKVFTASDDLTVVAGAVASISIVVTVNPA